MNHSKELFLRRKRRQRYGLSQKSDRLRLSVFRSGQHIYAQIIDDVKGVTLAAASTLDKDLRASLKSFRTIEAAQKVGLLLAERAKQIKVEKVVFDRGGYLYHGRVKALAEGAREGGLQF